MWDSGQYYVRRGKEFIKIVNKPGWYQTSEKSGAFQYFTELDGYKPEKIDTRTGEVLSTNSITRDNTRNYRTMMKDCGQRTKVHLHSENTTVIGIFEVPYREVRQRIQGTYKDRIGYTFRLSKADFDWLFSFPHQIEEYDHSKISIKLMRDLSEMKRKRIIADGGYFAWKRHYG